MDTKAFPAGPSPEYLARCLKFEHEDKVLTVGAQPPYPRSDPAYLYQEPTTQANRKPFPSLSHIVHTRVQTIRRLMVILLGCEEAGEIPSMARVSFAFPDRAHLLCRQPSYPNEQGPIK